MKTFKKLGFAALLLAGLALSSCGGNNGNTQEAGTTDGREANGDIDGSDAPGSNSESGSAAGGTANDEGTSPNDTVQGTTTNSPQ